MSRLLRQREAVYKATVRGYEKFIGMAWQDGKNLIPEARKDFGPRMKNVRSYVNDCLIDWFENDEVTMTDAFKEKVQNREYLQGYVKGLISNWWRKDWRYNETARGYKTRMNGNFLERVPIDRNQLPDQLKHLVEVNGEPAEPISTLNPDGKSRACECGARHTAFPNVHMNYCPMKEWK